MDTLDRTWWERKGVIVEHSDSVVLRTDFLTLSTSCLCAEDEAIPLRPALPLDNGFASTTIGRPVYGKLRANQPSDSMRLELEVGT